MCDDSEEHSIVTSNPPKDDHAIALAQIEHGAGTFAKKAAVVVLAIAVLMGLARFLNVKALGFGTDGFSLEFIEAQQKELVAFKASIADGNVDVQQIKKLTGASKSAAQALLALMSEFDSIDEFENQLTRPERKDLRDKFSVAVNECLQKAAQNAGEPALKAVLYESGKQRNVAEWAESIAASRSSNGPESTNEARARFVGQLLGVRQQLSLRVSE